MNTRLALARLALGPQFIRVREPLPADAGAEGQAPAAGPREAEPKDLIAALSAQWLRSGRDR
jgi:hypothetical protein